jgi:hypothetical protein
MAGKAHVHADIHRLGLLPAFFVQKIERLAQDPALFRETNRHRGNAVAQLRAGVR